MVEERVNLRNHVLGPCTIDVDSLHLRAFAVDGPSILAIRANAYSHISISRRHVGPGLIHTAAAIKIDTSDSIARLEFSHVGSHRNDRASRLV